MSANTFGTFLETLNTLSSAPVPQGPEADLLSIAHVVGTAGPEGAPVNTIAGPAGLSKAALLGGIFAGRDKGLFEIDDSKDEPVVRLTKLGRSLAE